MRDRLPAHLEASAILRLAQALGGIGTVLAKGERDAGTILLVVQRRGHDAALYERMPDLDRSRAYSQTRVQDETDPAAFTDYLDRRKSQDPDIWIIEVDVDDPAEFIAQLPD